MDTSRISRRSFTKHVCAGAAALVAGANAPVFVAPQRPTLTLIGCGTRGVQCIEALRQLGAAAPEIALVCDCDVPRARRWADELGVPAVSDWRACIAATEIDGLVIAAPDAAAITMQRQAAAAGKKVFRDCSHTSNANEWLCAMQTLGGHNGLACVFTPETATALAAGRLLDKGCTGPVHLAQSASGGCAQVVATHLRQVLMLLEAVRPTGDWRSHTIGAPSGASLMTEIVYACGPRFEITTSKKAVAVPGACLRGAQGALHLAADALTWERCGGDRCAMPVQDAVMARATSLVNWIHGPAMQDRMSPVRQIAMDIAPLA